MISMRFSCVELEFIVGMDCKGLIDLRFVRGIIIEIE